MQNNKNIFDFYQSSGIYNRIIFKQKKVEKVSTLNDLKDKILSLKDFYNKNHDQIIFSDGSKNSKIMIIGDAPGVKDEINQKPFSGEAGELLDKMLNAINIDRSKVYLTNIINFRLADNKKPSAEDIQRFKPLIYEHINIINPKVIFLLGSIVLEVLSNKNFSISEARGNWIKLNINNNTIDCLPSFHPSFLLQQPTQKKSSWEDLKKLKIRIDQENLC